jgi:hypothetical protein
MAKGQGGALASETLVAPRAKKLEPTLGKIRSGDVVPTITMSISAGPTPALFIACFAASTHMSEVVWSGATQCRRSTPVRVRIHSSLVSTIFSRSKLVSTFSGRYRPVPVILE